MVTTLPPQDDTLIYVGCLISIYSLTWTLFDQINQFCMTMNLHKCMYIHGVINLPYPVLTKILQDSYNWSMIKHQLTFQPYLGQCPHTTVDYLMLTTLFILHQYQTATNSPYCLCGQFHVNLLFANPL